ncbi:MAG TPA: hypothetical protein VGQ99_05490 [Tepidisphaeraceae bacterium]|jgi:hypothetical protein|nr:hypothetical protein [Tepidisphaeraceae bacterium]
MPRRLRSFILFLPLPLLFVVLYASARSYLPEKTFFRSQRGKLVMVFVSGTYIHWFDTDSNEYTSTTDVINNIRRVANMRKLPQGSWMGVEWIAIDFKSERPCILMIPYWYLATPLAIASAWWAITLRRRRIRNIPGHCAECGYDLRASDGKCPECGVTTSTPAAG